MKIEVEKEDLEKVFDTATSSLNFGSGWLDHDEVISLRRIARLLGADVKDATPINFRNYIFDEDPKGTSNEEGNCNIDDSSN